MRFLYISIITFSMLSPLKAQKIPQNPNMSDDQGRQGAWTLLFDNQWHPVSTADSAIFYRLIKYKNDKPIGKVRDYFPSGAIQWEGELIQDRPKEILHGESSYFLESGSLDFFEVYDNGKLDVVGTTATLKAKVQASPDRLDYILALGRHYHEAIRDKNNAEIYFKKYIEELGKQGKKATGMYVDALHQLGWVYLRHKDYVSTEPLFLEALEVVKKLEKPDYMRHTAALVAIGDMFRYMGRPALGLIYLKKGLELFERYPELMLFAKSLIHNNMAICYEVSGDIEAAIELELLVLEDYIKIFGGDHRELATAHNNLGSSYYQAAQYELAEKHLLLAAEMLERLFGREHQEFLSTNSVLGKIAAKKGDYQRAESTFLEAYKGLAKLSNENSSDVIEDKRNYATILYLQGQKEKAKSIFRSTAQSRQNYIEEFFDYLSEPARVAFYKGYVPYFNSHITWAVAEHSENPELRSDIMNMQLRNKALLLNTTNKIKKRIMESGDRKLIALYDDVQEIRQLLGNMSTMSAEKARQQFGVDKDSLQLIYEQKDRDLNRLSSLYASGNRSVKWQDIQAKLEKKEALVEIVRYNVTNFKGWETTDSVRYVGLIVTPKTKDHPELVDLTEGNLLEGRAFKQYQNSIRFKQKDEKSYLLFWEPLKKRLKGIKKVYISLDGIYHKVNLQALQNPQDEAFVMDEMEVNLVTSGRDLVEEKSEKLPLKLGLLLGNPAFGELQNEKEVSQLYGFEQLLDRTERSGLAELPGAEREVKTLQKLFKEHGWREITLINEQAEERALKEMLKPNVLHIATHGFFQPNKADVGNKNPLYRSGLLLTGAAETLSNGGDFSSSDSGMEDGVLTSFEAMNLNIDNTNLVVLSACETGLGVFVNGEGVYGLQRAFKIAGARTVIMSLWKVDDASTQDLMIKFYENWLANGMSKREALSAAQHDLKKKYPHPYFWGAFVILGE